MFTYCEVYSETGEYLPFSVNVCGKEKKFPGVRIEQSLSIFPTFTLLSSLLDLL